MKRLWFRRKHEKEDLVGFDFVDGVGLMRGDILRVWEVTAKFES